MTLGARDLNTVQYSAVQQRCWDLRIQGLTMQQISKRILEEYDIRVSPAWVFQKLKAEFTQQEVESREVFRKYELERLDKLQQAATQLFMHASQEVTVVADDQVKVIVTDTKNALAALKEMRGISESRRKLLGLDADHMLAEQVVAQKSAAELELEELLRSLHERNSAVIRDSRRAEDASSES